MGTDAGRRLAQRLAAPARPRLCNAYSIALLARSAELI
jgi:hypothetical protein